LNNSDKNNSLQSLGWAYYRHGTSDADDVLEVSKPDLYVGRITALYPAGFCRITFGEGVILVSTRNIKQNTTPVTGDWILFRKIEQDSRGVEGIVEEILPRRTGFSRKAAGKETKEQCIAANIDYILIIIGLDANFKISRIERYLTAAWESGAQPVIVLNKSDVCGQEELFEKRTAAEKTAVGCPVFVTSAATGEGLGDVSGLLEDNKTAVLAGSSGVGKSSIINYLVGDSRQAVQSVRKGDGKGRHTTTVSELLVLPNGGCIIDTPGMRELQVWSSPEALQTAFSDIEELAADCRFRDCTHQHEPDCSVQEAIKKGQLSPQRFESYLKLQKEIAFLERRKDENWQRLERERGKQFAKYVKNHVVNRKKPGR
jgi:ribosome biogenesis GTPase